MQDFQDNRCTVPFGDHPGYVNDIDLTKNTVSSCCKIGKVPIDPVTGVLTPQLVDLRKSIIKNERNEQCRACWETEDAGGISLRRRISTHANKSINWEQLDPFQPIQHIGVMFSNKCQMMCSYCGPHASSMWENFLSNNNLTSVEYSKPKLQSLIDITKLKSIKITGGEPMINDDCIEFLTDLPDNPHREISINTNLSFGKATFSKLRTIIDMHSNILIATSLDSIGDNITRKFFNWDMWEQNFKNLVSCISAGKKGLTLHITITVGCLNYKDVSDVIIYILNFRKMGINVLFDINPLQMNSILSVAATEIDKTAIVSIPREYQIYLNARDRRIISEYNDMLQKLKFNPELSEKTIVFLTQHLSKSH